MFIEPSIIPSIHYLQLCHTPNGEDARPQSPHSQPVENCCATSLFVHGSLVYDNPSASACPVHQDVSPHTYSFHCVVT